MNSNNLVGVIELGNISLKCVIFKINDDTAALSEKISKRRTSFVKNYFVITYIDLIK